MMDLGRDGVLRSLNAAHDTVVDFVQLSGPQITEFFAKTGSDPSVMSGVYVCSDQPLSQQIWWMKLIVSIAMGAP